ncbi:unnamed protein product [Caenorhabditis nigoni]
MAEPARQENAPKPDFRLMDLDYWCRRRMISHWDVKKQIAFSHCSKESFELVKSLNQKPEITITLDELKWITVNIGKEVLGRDSEIYLIKLVDEEIAIPGYTTPINFGLNARDAFVHLCEMYHQKELTIRLNMQSKTPLDAIRNVFDGFPVHTITYCDGSNREDEKAYIRNMLEFLLPSKTLVVSRNPYDTYQEFRDNVLQFEYETLVLQRPEQIDLLHLKAMNTEINLTMAGRNLPITTQQFQGFIEKWIKSEAYPKFKTIVFHAESRGVGENYQERILDGLLYQQLPSGWRSKNVPGGIYWGEFFQVSGNFEVQREADGQKAVISFATFGQAVLWKFFVV